jgi:hypothetical protein
VVSRQDEAGFINTPIRTGELKREFFAIKQSLLEGRGFIRVSSASATGYLVALLVKLSPGRLSDDIAIRHFDFEIAAPLAR